LLQVLAVPHLAQAAESACVWGAVADSSPSLLQKRVQQQKSREVHEDVIHADKVESQCLPSGFKAATVRNGGKPFRMAVLQHRDIVSESVAEHGFWEVESAEGMAATAQVALPPSGTFLDIGANLGYYSLLFAKRGFNAIAVEPSSHNRLGINASLCMNPDIAGLVRMEPVALAEEREVQSMRCVLRSTNTQINIGNMFLNCGSKEKVDTCSEGELACEDVPVKTLDTLLGEVRPSRIDVVKIDIEGHECQVLASGDSLFSQHSPRLVQVETNVGKALQCVEQKAQQHSYLVLAVSPVNSAMIRD